jgi:hypothetical protein
VAHQTAKRPSATGFLTGDLTAHFLKTASSVLAVAMAVEPQTMISFGRICQLSNRICPTPMCTPRCTILQTHGPICHSHLPPIC